MRIKKYEKWNLSEITVFVWAVCEYSFIKRISIDCFVKLHFKNE